MPVWDLQNAEGGRFSVHMIGRLTDDRLDAIESLETTAFSISGLQIERMRIVFDETRPTEARASAVVIPQRFEIAGRRYEEYMPSGMQFNYEDAPFFDFRMLVDNLAVRINGAYLTEEQFLERIQRAVRNPAAYIQSSDPQYLAAQLRELQRLVDMLEVAGRELTATDEELREEIAESRAAGMRKSEEIESEIDEVRSDIADVGEDLTAFGVEVEEALDAIVTDNLSLTEQFEKMRQGSIVLASRNLFGSLKGVPPETVAAVVELREGNPGLSADDARSQVNASLGSGAQQLESKHVQAIYALFFNDYE